MKDKVSEVFTEYQAIEPPRRSELPACPVQTCVQLVGSKWKLLIMRDLLLNGSMRFKELQRSIGDVSQKVLTSNLREMESDGLVVRRVYPEVPPRVEYSLTGIGESLRPIMDAMWAWGESYQALAV
ncbi:winged helix-turn-helix transcriptional regulator [Ellagibacter sp.]|uniref:winged helix-turn-helix transcriptional regulator n=1 Tax=Ellagibacter sp. TaxID=2137578 RepID=UPI003AB3B7B7